MKLASYQDGSRDGHLVVVSHDLTTAHYASGIATRLQQVLDDWNFLSPQLEDLSTSLNHGRARHAFPFDAALCLAPLPRAYQRVVAVAAAPADGSLPLLQRSGNALFGPAAAPALAGDAGLAVICGDVPAGASADSALEGVRLLLLAFEFDAGAAFAPLAVTPDELGAAWRGGRAHVGIDSRREGHRERRDAAAMPQPFGELIAALAARGAVGAGSIVGSAALLHLPAGERLHLEATGADGHSIFGAIDTRKAGAQAS